MKRAILALAILIPLASVVAGQLRVDVTLVNVIATVTDDQGRFVSDLTQKDFVLEEDGMPQEILHFSKSNELPVSVGIVLDTSSSMERKIGTATRAVDRFIRSIHQDDEIFLMTFDTSPKVRQDFTSNREKLSNALNKTKLGSGTALYDGLITGLEKIRKAKHSKKAILLISDGVDTTSDQDFETALLVTRESEVLVYCLGISPDRSRGPLSEQPSNPSGRSGQTPPSTSPFPIPLPGPGRRFVGPHWLPQYPQHPQGRARRMPSLDSIDMDILDSFAHASGGNSWLISTGNDGRSNQIQDALDAIADELRNQYTLGYYPGHTLQDGRWHRIDIRTRFNDLKVRAKKEYFGDEKK